MIEVRAPLRVCLGGGGTDLEPYYSVYGGFICSVAIDKSVTVEIEIGEPFGSNPMFDACVDHVGPVDVPLRLFLAGDIEPGSGLGGSGALAVAICAGLEAIQCSGRSSLTTLAKTAYGVEHGILGRPVGVQDQMIAAHGGAVMYDILRSGDIPFVTQVPMDFSLMGRWVSLFKIGQQRDAAVPLAQQSAGMASGANIDLMHRIKQIGQECAYAAMAGAWVTIGRLFHEHWELKRQTASAMSNPRIDELYNLALNSGAIGGKVAGAGGGGYFVFVCEPCRFPSVKAAMEASGLEHMPVRFGAPGVEVKWTTM